MTMILTNGKTANRHRRDEIANAEYRSKILANSMKTVSRFGACVVAHVPPRPKTGTNRMILFFRGEMNETQRIAKVLGVTVDQIESGSTLPVKFGRIKVMVAFRKNAEKVNEAHNKRQRKVA